MDLYMRNKNRTVYAYFKLQSIANYRFIQMSDMRYFYDGIWRRKVIRDTQESVKINSQNLQNYIFSSLNIHENVQRHSESNASYCYIVVAKYNFNASVKKKKYFININ